jgi:hypothetical protein
MVGLAVVVAAMGGFGVEGHSLWRWCLVILAVLAGALIFGALLNFVIFAPIYWLLGRLHSKKTGRDKSS